MGCYSMKAYDFIDTFKDKGTYRDLAIDAGTVSTIQDCLAVCVNKETYFAGLNG